MNVNQTALSVVKLGPFPKNCVNLSEEQGERFHQDICNTEEFYQGW